MKTKFNIGDRVYHATWDQHHKESRTCPECGGTGKIRVIRYDHSVAHISCVNCSTPFASSTGKVDVYIPTAYVDSHIISGMEISGDQVTYKANLGWGCYMHLDEKDTFATVEEAQVKAEREAEVEAEFNQKHDRSQDWAWNASYHKKQIKEAEKSIAYHTKKLNVANLKKEG